MLTNTRTVGCAGSLSSVSDPAVPRIAASSKSGAGVPRGRPGGASVACAAFSSARRRRLSAQSCASDARCPSRGPARIRHPARRGLGAGADARRPRALALAGVAAELDATSAFVAGLRLTPAGSRLATRLGLPDFRSVTAEPRAGTPPPLALGFEQLARASTMRARADRVAQPHAQPGAATRVGSARSRESARPRGGIRPPPGVARASRATWVRGVVPGPPAVGRRRGS